MLFKRGLFLKKAGCLCHATLARTSFKGEDSSTQEQCEGSEENKGDTSDDPNFQLPIGAVNDFDGGYAGEAATPNKQRRSSESAS